MLKTNILKNENGISLIEIVVVLIIIGIVSSIAYGVILMNAGTFRRLSDELTVRWDLRKALQIMRQDFSQIDPDNIFGFSKGKSANFKLFFKDVNGNKIFYTYQNGMLRRRQNTKKSEIIISNLKQTPIELLDSQFTLTKNKKDIAFIRVNLVVEINGKKRSLSDTFFLRN